MAEGKSKKVLGQGAGALGRRGVSLAAGDLVRAGRLELGGDRSLALFEPAVAGVNLSNWAARQREVIDDALLKEGAVLFRGFGMGSAEELESLISATSGGLLKYEYGSTPRRQVAGNIYTSTEYPSDQSIPLHNEMSYSSGWPLRICFFCQTPAAEGGETPLADSRRVLRRIDPPVRERFERRGVMYVRNYGDELDLPWEEVFLTRERSEVESYCRRAGVEWEWREGNRLRTRQVTQAVATHPRTGEEVWFNQAHLFHVSNLRPELGEALRAAFGEDGLPRNAYYGDGSRLEPEVLEHVRGAYEREALVFGWRAGDVLLLDNMLTAHGRNPYSGARRVLVGMADHFVNENVRRMAEPT